MKRLFLIMIILLFGFSSCERKPGIASQKHPAKPSPTQPYSKSNSYSPSSGAKPSVPSNSNSTIMAGPDIFEKYNSAVFMVFTSDGYKTYQGSGFFISPSGMAVSNYHVFQGTTKGYEEIKLSSGSRYKIKRVIVKDEDEDIIIFEIDAQGNRFNYIPIASKSPRVGEKAYAIGSPRGLENTFSSGEISQLRGDAFIQINVPIDHGSSGGALLNEKGEAIGITTAGIDESGANLNFAVNIKVLRKYLR